MPLFLSAGLLLVLPADAIHGAIKEGITTWVPTMITETYNTPVAFSVFVSIILPIVNLSGNYIVTPLYNKVFKKDELKTGAAILAFVLIIIDCALCPLLYFNHIFGFYYLIVIAIAVILFIYSAILIIKNQDRQTASKVSKYLKIGMLIAFVSFVFGSF
mgnify:CR=1 FL=1